VAREGDLTEKGQVVASERRPNILFIMSDDHGKQAVGSYGSVINETPHMDRIADDGMRLENCFCTNSICAPSRATILTGTYSHVNGVLAFSPFDGRQLTFPKLLRAAGYQTAVIGKWHLGQGGVSAPRGFDYWNVLPGQGLYHNPEMIEMGTRRVYEGYVTDLITDMSLEWLKSRDRDRPFCLLTHHKCPHRPWEPDQAHADLYADYDIPVPANFDDDYTGRASAAAAATMRIERDLDERDLKEPPPPGLSYEELKHWKYQRFIKDYLRVVASMDDGIGRMLDYLDAEGLTDNTIVVYTSDQGFFLGEHGWFDKRFMYEESLRMPFLVRYPEEIGRDTSCERMVLNVDFAPTFLDYAGLPIPARVQGRSMRSLLRGEAPADWRTSMYYRYWLHLAHHGVYAHYGVRTDRHKLIYYYAQALEAPGAIDEDKQPEWELFDLTDDPSEMRSVYGDRRYGTVERALKAELRRLRRELGDERTPWVEQ
jgi:arylsulfatase A-like enzyme